MGKSELNSILVSCRNEFNAHESPQFDSLLTEIDSVLVSFTTSSAAAVASLSFDVTSMQHDSVSDVSVRTSMLRKRKGTGKNIINGLNIKGQRHR